MQTLKLSDEQIQSIARFVTTDILAYCTANATLFDEFKQNLLLKEGIKNASKTNSSNTLSRKSC